VYVLIFQNDLHVQKFKVVCSNFAKNLAEEGKTRKIRKEAGVGYAILQVCEVQAGL